MYLKQWLEVIPLPFSLLPILPLHFPALVLQELFEVLLATTSCLNQGLILLLIVLNLLFNELFRVEINQQFPQSNIPHHKKEPIPHYQPSLSLAIAFLDVLSISVTQGNGLPLRSVLFKIQRYRKILHEFIETWNVIYQLWSQVNNQRSEQELQLHLRKGLRFEGLILIIVVNTCKKWEIWKQIGNTWGISEDSERWSENPYSFIRSLRESTGIASKIWFSSCLVCSHRLVGINISLIELT